MQYMMVNRRGPPERVGVTEAVPVPTSSIEPRPTPRAGHRRFARARAVSVFARLRVGDGVVVTAIDDISMGGLFARTTHAIPAGAFVELTLLRPGEPEVQLGGVVVDDVEKRQGLAFRFEAMSPVAATTLRRIVEALQDAQEGVRPDRGVARARPMKSATDEAPRDEELTTLRQRVALLTAENNRLRAEVEAGAEAEKLVGRLRLEVERLTARTREDIAVDLSALSDIKRDAEVIRATIARLGEGLDRLR